MAYSWDLVTVPDDPGSYLYDQNLFAAQSAVKTRAMLANTAEWQTYRAGEDLTEEKERIQRSLAAAARFGSTFNPFDVTPGSKQWKAALALGLTPPRDALPAAVVPPPADVPDAPRAPSPEYAAEVARTEAARQAGEQAQRELDARNLAKLSENAALADQTARELAAFNRMRADQDARDLAARENIIAGRTMTPVPSGLIPTPNAPGVPCMNCATRTMRATLDDRATRAAETMNAGIGLALPVVQTGAGVGAGAREPGEPAGQANQAPAWWDAVDPDTMQLAAGAVLIAAVVFIVIRRG